MMEIDLLLLSMRVFDAMGIPAVLQGTNGDVQCMLNNVTMKLCGPLLFKKGGQNRPKMRSG